VIFLGVLALLACSSGSPTRDWNNPSLELSSEKGLSQQTIKGAIMETETATFGAGCFWGVEAAFRQVPGVVATAVGYLGGTLVNPTYHDVCTDRTGHAEVVQVEFDPSKVTFDQLLDVFWANHDPTTLNRQGPDHGSQYRSAIFFHSPEQEKAAEASKERIGKSGKFRRPIVTEITPASTFYKAEDYHQQYLEKRGLASCHI
jgi:peptide-methionine (S)-S-oxide reductase